MLDSEPITKHSVACRVQIWWAAIFGKGVVAPVIDAFVGRMCPLVVDPEEGRRYPLSRSNVRAVH